MHISYSRVQTNNNNKQTQKRNTEKEAKRIKTKLWQVQHSNGVAADAQHQQLKECRQGLTARVGTNACIYHTYIYLYESAPGA